MEAFLTMFELVNGPNYNGNVPFGDQKWVQNGSKMTLFKMDWESIGNNLGPFWNVLEAVWTVLELVNGPNYNRNVPFWDRKRVKKRSKMTFLTMEWRPGGNILGVSVTGFPCLFGWILGISGWILSLQRLSRGTRQGGSKGGHFGVKNEDFPTCPRVIMGCLYDDFEWFQPILKGCDAFPCLLGWILGILGPFWNHFEAFLTMFGPMNGQNYNGNGPFWAQSSLSSDTYVDNSSKTNLLSIGRTLYGSSIS